MSATALTGFAARRCECTLREYVAAERSHMANSDVTVVQCLTSLHVFFAHNLGMGKL